VVAVFPRALRALVLPVVLAAVASASAPSWAGWPGREAADDAPPPAPHQVVSGDSLWGLAQAAHTTVWALKALNHLVGDVIVIGTQLQLPGSGAAVTGAGAARTAASYLVRPGDTLTGIAERLGTTTRALALTNHLADPDVVVLGSRLRVPPAARTVPTTTGAQVGSDAAALAAAVTAPPAPAYRAAVAHSRLVLANRLHVGTGTAAALVRAEALRQGVDPSLALALATQESGLAQRMVSRTDAVGIMQLMPGTADWIGRFLLGRAVDRYDAADNVRAGVAYLRVLLRRATPPTAVAGYYQGLGDVLRRGMLPETRAYVADVLALQSAIQRGLG
jgi:LysM repeat protein